MGASEWEYYVPYEADLDAALARLRWRVFSDGDFWWAAKGEFGKSAKDYADRPSTVEELWADGSVQESGTHSILDMVQVVADGEEPDYNTVQPVTPAEALASAGTERLTREHVPDIHDLADRRWFGRCAILHDAGGGPTEIYFWGFSGD